MTNKNGIKIIVVLTIIATGLGVFMFLVQKQNNNSNQQNKNVVEQNIISQKQNNSLENIANQKSDNQEYIVAEKSELIPGGGREHKYFTIYDKVGKLINKVSLPKDAALNFAGSKKIFGNKIYYLSGSKEITSIAELSPMSGQSRVFDFTQTKSTNVGNVLSAIVGWTVFNDNQRLAWVDTDCTVYIANTDGSNYKVHKFNEGKCIRAKIYFSKNKNKIYVWNGRNDFLREMTIDDGRLANVIKSENGLFLMSPSERYVIYSNFDTPLAIRDFTDNKNINIELSEKYDFYYFDKFSPDEQIIYLTAGNMDGDEESHYAIKANGTESKIIDEREVSDSFDFLNEKGESFIGLIK